MKVWHCLPRSGAIIDPNVESIWVKFSTCSCLVWSNSSYSAAHSCRLVSKKEPM